LIVDDNALNGKLCCAILKDRYQVFTAATTEEGLKSAKRILLVAALDGSDNKTKGLEAGADDFLNKPVHTAELKAKVKSLLRLKSYSDQLKARSHAMGMLLNPFSSDETLFELRLPSLLTVEDSPADAKQIKENASTRSTQIIVVAFLQDIESKIKGFEFGVDDYLVKPINFNEFRARVNSLIKKKAYHDRLMANFEVAVQSAITDKLTGAYNNGYFQHYLKNELKRAERHAYPISLLMLDIDDFKIVNDRHGHLAGDKLLKEIAEKLRQNMREIDVLARFGGDEFAIVLPYTQKEDAAAIAERIRVLFENCAVAVNDHVSLNISMSIGVAGFVPGVDALQDVIQKADKALYTAKFAGKNKVVSAAEGSSVDSLMN